MQVQPSHATIRTVRRASHSGEMEAEKANALADSVQHTKHATSARPSNPTPAQHVAAGSWFYSMSVRTYNTAGTLSAATAVLALLNRPHRRRVISARVESAAGARLARVQAGMRLSVRQRWCSLLGEISCPHRHHGRPLYPRLAWLPSAQSTGAQSIRLVSNNAALSHSQHSPAAPPPPTHAAVFAPPLSASSQRDARDDVYHQALSLAARAAHLGHPHAVVAIIDSLRRQQTNAVSITHPALYNQLLRAYLRCSTLLPDRRFEKMREVWSEMEADNVRCNQRTYSLLLNGCIRKHRQLLNEQPATTAHTHTAAPSSPSSPYTSATGAYTGPSCLLECSEFMQRVPLSTSTCNLLMKAALLSANRSYPFVLFQHSFPPLVPNASTLSLIVDTALATPARTGGVNSAMEWYVKVRETSRAPNRPPVVGTQAMYAKLMRRCLQSAEGAAAGTEQVQHVPVLFSHMEEAGVLAEAEHIRCLLLALSRLQLNGASWGVWLKMESERRVQRTDETDALMLRVMSEEKDHKRAMEVITSIEQRWAANRSASTPLSAVSSRVVSNYRSALSNFSRNGHSVTLLALLSHVFSSHYSSAVLRAGMLESVVRRWREAGRSVHELRAKVRQWVAAMEMTEREIDGWRTLAVVLSRGQNDTTATTPRPHSHSLEQSAVPSLQGPSGGNEEDRLSVSMDVHEADEADDENDLVDVAGPPNGLVATVLAPSTSNGAEAVNGSKLVQHTELHESVLCCACKRADR